MNRRNERITECINRPNDTNKVEKQRWNETEKKMERTMV